MSRYSLLLRILLYALYGILLLGVLLYVRFPTEKFRLFCERWLESTIDGSDVSIDGIRVQWPLAIHLETVTVAFFDSGDPRGELVVEGIDIIPRTPRFWRTFTLRAQGDGASVRADLEMTDGYRGFSLTEVLLTDLDLARLTTALDVVDRSFAGTLRLSGSYQATLEAPLGGTGEGQVQLSGGWMELMQPVLALNQVNFTEITGELSYQDTLVAVQAGEFSGPELSGTFSGEIRLASPLATSSLTLSGQLQPEPGFLAQQPGEKLIVERMRQRFRTEMLPFTVGGTARRPTFRFSR